MLAFGQTAARGNRVQHEHHLVILQRLDLPFAGTRHADRVETVGNIFIQQLVAIKLFEQYRYRGFFTCQRLVGVFVNVDGVSGIDFISAAVIQKQIDIDRLYLFQIRKLDFVRCFRLRQVCFLNQIFEKKHDIVQIGQPCRRQHISLQIREKTAQKSR